MAWPVLIVNNTMIKRTNQKRSGLQFTVSHNLPREGNRGPADAGRGCFHCLVSGTVHRAITYIFKSRNTNTVPRSEHGGARQRGGRTKRCAAAKLRHVPEQKMESASARKILRGLPSGARPGFHTTFSLEGSVNIKRESCNRVSLRKRMKAGKSIEGIGAGGVCWPRGFFVARRKAPAACPALLAILVVLFISCSSNMPVGLDGENMGGAEGDASLDSGRVTVNIEIKTCGRELYYDSLCDSMIWPEDWRGENTITNKIDYSDTDIPDTVWIKLNGDSSAILIDHHANEGIGNDSRTMGTRSVRIWRKRV